MIGGSADVWMAGLMARGIQGCRNEEMKRWRHEGMEAWKHGSKEARDGSKSALRPNRARLPLFWFPLCPLRPCSLWLVCIFHPQTDLVL